jgi:hypothetical protein
MVIMSESIVEFVRRNLHAAGPRRYGAIAAATGVAESFVRKVANGGRRNPRVATIEPLVDFFLAVERGERELPPPAIDPRYLPKEVRGAV